MDGLRWSKVLVQWVTHSKLIEGQFNDIEQCSVEDFYQQFRARMEPTLAIREDNVVDFLKEHFPHYEFYLNESGRIAAPDRFYIVSLLLYFSCVRHADSFFQQICNNLDKLQQIAVEAFLKSMLDGSHQQKEIDRMMIQRAIQDAMPQTMLPPVVIKSEPQRQSTSSAHSSSQSQSQSSQLSVPSRMASADLLDSPLRLNNRVPRLSPPTPKTVILDERTKQLKELKAQLEAERYEKGYLEMQLKQLQDKNERFMEDKRKHLKEIRELKAAIQACDRDENESPNVPRSGGDGTGEHKLARVQRQLAEKEDLIDQLKLELETVNENNRHATEMINYRNTQIAKLNSKILELEGSIVTLSECVEEKEEVIKCLRENNDDLQNFIKENRLERNGAAATDNLNTSFECLDLSAVASSTGTSGGTGPSPENMACAVVDVQLKEKEAENGLLKRSLEMYEQEKVRISGLVGQFFRLYDEAVGKLPGGALVAGTTVGEVSFVEKMNTFKTCYEALFEEYGKVRAGKEALEDRNDALEDDVRRLKGEVIAKEEVLRDLEVRSAEIERELGVVRKASAEYQRHNDKQKREFLKLIAEKDHLSKQNLTLNVEFNSLKEEYESIMQKIDYLMVSLNEDYEDGDYSSWFEKLDDLTSRLAALKEDKERIAALNMKVALEKISLQKEISNGEEQRKCLQENQAEAESKIRLLREELDQSKRELDEKSQIVSRVEQEKLDVQKNIDLLKEELQQTQSSLQNALKELDVTTQSLEASNFEALRGKEQLSEVKERNTELISDLEKQNAVQQSLENHQRQLLSKIAQLETDLQVQTGLLEQVHRRQDECNAQNRLLSDRISDLQAKNNDLEQTIVEQRNVSENNRKQIDKLTIHARELEGLLEVETQRSQTLERDMNDRHEREQHLLRESTTEKDMLVSANRSLLSGLIVIQNGIKSLEKEYAVRIGTLQQKLEQFSTLLSKLSTQQFKMRMEKTSLEQALAQMKGELESLQQENQQLMAEKDTILEEASRVKEAKTAVEDRNVKLEGDVNGLNVALQLEQTKVKELNHQVQSLTNEKGKILEQGSQMDTDIRRQLNDANMLSNKLREEIKRLETEMAELQLELKEKAGQILQLAIECGGKASDCTRLEGELKEAHSNLANQKQLTAQQLEMNDSLEQELLIVREELSRLEADNSRLDADLSEKSSEIDRQASTVSRLCHDKELLEQKVQELAAGLSAIRQSKATVKEEFDQEREKSDELESQLSALSEKLAEVSGELHRAQDELQAILTHRDGLLMEKQELTQELEELRESNALLEEDRDTLREEKCRLAAEIDRIDSDKEAIGEQCTKLLTELAKERETSKVSNGKHEARIKELAEETVALENKLKEALKAHNSASEKVAELEQTKRLLEESLSDKTSVEARISQLSEKVAKLQFENSQLESEKQTILEKLEAQHKVVEQLNESKHNLSDSNNNLEKQIASKEAVISEMEAQLLNLTSAFESAAKQIEVLEEKKTSLVENVSNKETELAKNLTLIANLQSDLANVNNALKQKCAELQLLSEQLLESERQAKASLDEHESVKQKHLTFAEELTAKHKEALEKVENVQQQTGGLESTVKELTEKLKLSASEIASSQQKVDLKDKEIRALKQVLNNCQAKCAEFETNIKKITADKVELETRLTEARKELDVHTRTLTSKQEELEKLTSRLSESTESNQSLQKHSEELQVVRTSLETQIQTLRLENESLKGTIVAREGEIHQLTEGLNQVNSFQSKLEAKVTEYETIIAEKDKLEIRLKELENEASSVRDEKTDTERRLIQQLHEYDTLNEAYLNERDANKAMKLTQEEQERKVLVLTEENNRNKSQLFTKEKLLSDKDKQMERLKEEIDGLFGKNRRVDTLTHEMVTLKMQKAELEAKRDELQECIQHQEVQQRTMQENLQQLRNSLRSKQQELDSLHSEMTSMKDNMHGLKIENSRLQSNHDLQQTKLLNLELKTTEQSKKIEHLEHSLSKTELSHLEDNSKVNALLNKLESYKQQEAQLRKLEELHEREQNINKKYQMDIEILRAKLVKNRKQTDEMEQQWNADRKQLAAKLADSTKTAEEKVHEIRTDYEEKLEKLKVKMIVQSCAVSSSTTGSEETFSDLSLPLPPVVGDSVEEPLNGVENNKIEAAAAAAVASVGGNRWKRLIYGMVKYPLIVVVVNILLFGFMRRRLSDADFELVLKPAMPPFH